MIIVISTDIFCDGDDCGNWVHGATGPRTNSKQARLEGHGAARSLPGVRPDRGGRPWR